MAINEYATNTEVENSLPAGTGTITIRDDIIRDAQSIINSYLGNRYVVPFPIPIIQGGDLQIIKMITIWIASYMRATEKFGENTPVKMPESWNRYSRALELLKMLADGSLSLPNESTYLISATGRIESEKIFPSLEWKDPVEYSDLPITGSNG